MAFAKTGAEGSYGLSLMGRGVGIAIKVEDGNPRALNPVVIEVLRQYGILGGETLHRLKAYGPRLPIFNHRRCWKEMLIYGRHFITITFWKE